MVFHYKNPRSTTARYAGKLSLTYIEVPYADQISETEISNLKIPKKYCLCASFKVLNDSLQTLTWQNGLVCLRRRTNTLPKYCHPKSKR